MLCFLRKGGPQGPTPTMAGLDSNPPIPTEIRLHQTSRVMELSFADGTHFRLPYEYLRVYSPSAEVRGHGPGQETLQIGKRDVGIAELEAVGHYAVRPKFTDGHDTGIYSWPYLYDLGARHDQLWSQYLSRLEQAGASRDADPGPSVAATTGHGCGGGRH